MSPRYDQTTLDAAAQVLFDRAARAKFVSDLRMYNNIGKEILALQEKSDE